MYFSAFDWDLIFWACKCKFRVNCQWSVHNLCIWILPFENFDDYFICKIMFHQCNLFTNTEYFYTYNPSSYIVQYLQLQKRKQYNMWCWFQSISNTAKSLKQNVIAACKGISEKAVSQIISRRNHRKGLPLFFVFSWKHMASTCSVSCSEFFITVTVLMSQQTQQIVC